MLHAYTAGASTVEAAGATVDAVLNALDAQFPGLRFRIIDEQDRIRPHIKIFIGEDQVASIDAALGVDDTVQIVGALSGG